MRPKWRGAELVALLCLVFQIGHAAERTSIDLYCQSMILSLIETTQYVTKKEISVEKIQKSEKALSDMCLATPAINSMAISVMSAKDIAVISCVGFAEGAYVAYQPKSAPDEPYSKLKARREFAANACGSNPKRFQNDIFRRGPDYVLTQKY